MGKLLIVLLPVLIGFVVGYLAGRAARKTPPQLDDSEKRELNSYRDQEMELIEKASEAATLGDSFGVIALSIIGKNRASRSINK